MSPRKLPARPATRVSRNMTLSPVTESRLEKLAYATGVARGRIVDIALANIMACEACHGRGTTHDDTQTCDGCRGARIVPGGA